MANLAREDRSKPNVYRYAIRSISGLDSWLRDRFRYRDEFNEIVRSPEWCLRDLETQGYIEGDCDDIATLAVCLLSCSGFAARLTALESLNSRDGFDHVFAEGWDGHWVPVDPTVPYGTAYQYLRMVHEPV